MAAVSQTNVNTHTHRWIFGRFDAPKAIEKKLMGLRGIAEQSSESRSALVQDYKIKT